MEIKDGHLDELFREATRVELRPLVLVDRLIGPGAALWELNGAELAELRPAVRVIIPDEPTTSATWGDHMLQFYGPQGLIGSLELLDFSSVRWGARWKSEAELADGGLGLAQWMDRFGHPEPLRTYHQRGQKREERERWLEAMPGCLVGVQGRAAQLEALGDGAARALLGWLGTAGQASATQQPVALLATLPIEDIVAALEAADPGVLRGGWLYLKGNTRLQYIPRHLRQAMRESG